MVQSLSELTLGLAWSERALTLIAKPFSTMSHRRWWRVERYSGSATLDRRTFGVDGQVASPVAVSVPAADGGDAAAIGECAGRVAHPQSSGFIKVPF
jgi:hypothetical protein